MSLCSKFDLARKEWKIPHDFIRGYCTRCGELEPKEKRERIKKYSGKSKSINKFNEYND